ncbi:MAG TPA: A24 family peptidase, partial [Magnetospirillaceae bacterium]|nr:A24 family peptidase [Magnetospirillaceae bacterium]
MTTELAEGVFLALVLGWASLIDARHMILPDWLTLPLIPIGWALAWRDAEPPLSDRLIGSAAGFFVLASIAWIYRRVRGRDGLGLGDAKLVAAAGAWAGWQAIPSVVLIGSVSALAWVAVRRPDPNQPMPFGPFLALGFWLT